LRPSESGAVRVIDGDSAAGCASDEVKLLGCRPAERPDDDPDHRWRRDPSHLHLQDQLHHERQPPGTCELVLTGAASSSSAADAWYQAASDGLPSGTKSFTLVILDETGTPIRRYFVQDGRPTALLNQGNRFQARPSRTHARNRRPTIHRSATAKPPPATTSTEGGRWLGVRGHDAPD
jgi:hypothetical protein